MGTFSSSKNRSGCDAGDLVGEAGRIESSVGGDARVVGADSVGWDAVGDQRGNLVIENSGAGYDGVAAAHLGVDAEQVARAEEVQDSPLGSVELGDSVANAGRLRVSAWDAVTKVVSRAACEAETVRLLEAQAAAERDRTAPRRTEADEAASPHSW